MVASSGTAALEIALRVLGATGEKVAIPAFGCLSVERAVRRAGGRPVLIDVDESDLSFPRGSLFRSAAAGCKVAVLVHQFGIPAAAADEVDEAPLAVIEDVTTTACGARRGRPLGSFGRLAVISLGATKLLCGGEGGALAGTPADIDRACAWTDPESDLSEFEPVSNAKLDDLSAALARAQLRRLPEILARRAAIAARYDKAVAIAGTRAWHPAAGDIGTWWRYLVEVPKGSADLVVDEAAQLGVAFARPVKSRTWTDRRTFPISDRIRESVVSIPIYPGLTDDEVGRVTTALLHGLRAAS